MGDGIRRAFGQLLRMLIGAGLTIAFTFSLGTHARSAPVPDLGPIGRSFPISSTPGPDAVGGKNAIAFDGTNFLVVWFNTISPYGIRAARVTPTGSVLDPAGIQLSTESSSGAGPPSVAFDGTNFMVVWVADRCSCGYAQVFAARVTPAAAVLDAGGVQVTTANSVTGAKIRSATIAFDGTNHLVAYRSNADVIQALRMTTLGVSLDGAAGISLGHGFYPYVSFGGTKYLVTWHDGAGYCHCSIRGALIATDGSVATSNFEIASEGDGKDHSSAAFDGDNFLVVWHDYRGGTARDFDQPTGGSTYGTRVSPGGAVLDTPFQIAAHTRSQVSPRVVFDGTNYFVVWMTFGEPGWKFRLEDVYAARVTPSGVLLDRRPISVSAAVGHQFAPVVGYGGGRLLVAWGELQSFRGNYNGALWAQLMPASTDTSASVSSQTPIAAGWTTERSGGAPLYGVAGWSAGDVYAAGEDGAIVHRGASTWVDQPSISQRSFGVWATPSHDLWTSGWCGKVFMHNDSGWQETFCQRMVNPDDFGPTTALWAADRTYIVGVGSRSRFVRFDGSRSVCQPPNGGVTCIGVNQDVDQFAWALEDPGVSGIDFFGVWGSAWNDVYAVGEFGTIVHYDGGTWSLAGAVPTAQTLNAVWGTSATNVYAAGDSGTILHYDGSSWTVQVTPSTETLTAIWGSTATDIFAVGFNGTILHYDGSVWVPHISGSTAHLFGVWGAGGRVFAVGDAGTILSAATASCVTISPLRALVGARAGTGSVSVTAAAGCAWAASSAAGFLSVTSGAGPGNGTVGYSFSANTGAARRGSLLIGGQAFNVAQNSTAFTDTTLTAGSSRILLAHVMELRSRIDVARAANGLAGFLWRDPTLGTNSVVRARQIEDLRTALNDVYIAMGTPVPTYTDANVNGVAIKAIHLIELRAALAAIE